MNLHRPTQFGFRQKHGTTEEALRLINKIHNDLENKRYSSAAIIDISQAFDKVWHTGLFYKPKCAFVNKIHNYLENKRYCSAAFIDISQAFDKVKMGRLSLRRNFP